mgnify:CR=1 FL=1
MKVSRFPYGAVGLLDVISSLIESGGYFGRLPVGVKSVEMVTSESVRVMFIDRVDYDLLYRIAVKSGFSVNARGYSPRIIDDKGNIVARVGSRSDPGADRNIFIYIFPASTGLMSMYMRVIATRYGILNPSTNKINVEKLLKYNLKVIGLVEKYRKSRYKNLIRELKL